MKRGALRFIVLLIVGYYLYLMRGAVTSIGIVLLYVSLFCILLAPICTYMESRRIKKEHAAACAVIGLFLTVVLIFAALMPYLTIRSAALFKRISPLAIDILLHVSRWAEGFPGMGMLFAQSGDMMSKVLGGAAGKLFHAGITAATQIGRIFFSLILTYYVLCDRKQIGNHLLLCVPFSLRKPILSLLLACRNAMMSYLSGLMKTSAFVAGTTGVGLLVLGIPDAMLLALLMGVLEIFPYIGPVLAAIPILLSALMQGRDVALIALGLIVAVQQIEGGFVTPYFTASSTSVHPLVAVFSVFIGGNLMGIWGILLAIPTVVLAQSVIYSVLQMRHMIRSENWIYG